MVLKTSVAKRTIDNITVVIVLLRNIKRSLLSQENKSQVNSSEENELLLDPECNFVLNKNFISRVSEENEDQDSSSDDMQAHPIKKDDSSFNKRKTSWHKKREAKFKSSEPVISFPQKERKNPKRISNSFNTRIKTQSKKNRQIDNFSMPKQKKENSRQDRLGLRSSRGSSHWGVNKVSKSTNFAKGFKPNFLYSPKQDSGLQKLINNLNAPKHEVRRQKKQEIGKMANIRRSYDSRNYKTDAVGNSFDAGRRYHKRTHLKNLIPSDMKEGFGFNVNTEKSSRKRMRSKGISSRK